MTMTNEQIVERMQRGEDLQEELYKQNIRLIEWVSRKFAGQAGHADLVQDGFMGVMEAARRYDKAKGEKFSVYAVYWIYRYMWGTIEQGALVAVPRHKRAQIIKYRRFLSEYEKEHGVQPDDKTAAAALGLSLDKLRSVKDITFKQNIASFSAEIGDAEGVTLGDIIADPADGIRDAEERLQQEQLKEKLWGIVEELPDAEANIICKKYKEGFTFQELGEAYGKTASAARVIHDHAIRSLRRHKYKVILEPFVERSNLYSYALQGVSAGTFNRTWTSATERVALKDLERWEQ